ncbi:MAG TPA: hypothetical protein VIL85_29640 [Thermomicrobiales bacterium]|jgi:hypothetical protein
MIVPETFDPSPQYFIALVIAAPLLVTGLILALIVSHLSAWYARRWRASGRE